MNTAYESNDVKPPKVTALTFEALNFMWGNRAALWNAFSAMIFTIVVVRFLGGVFVDSPALSIGVSLIEFYLIIAMQYFTYRYILVDPSSMGGFSPLQISDDFKTYLIKYLKVFLIGLVCGLIVFALSFGLMFSLSFDKLLQGIGVVIVTIGAAIALIKILRFGTLLPAHAAGVDLTLGQSYSISAGVPARLLLSGLLLGFLSLIPIAIYYGAASYLSYFYFDDSLELMSFPEDIPANPSDTEGVDLEMEDLSINQRLFLYLVFELPATLINLFYFVFYAVVFSRLYQWVAAKEGLKP